MDEIPPRIVALIAEERERIQNGGCFSQQEVADITKAMLPYKAQLLQGEKDELLRLADPEGRPLAAMAPRWVCHLLGLRHRCVHIFLEWYSPALSRVALLQVRSWHKLDEPGCVDMSVSGHIVGDNSREAGAVLELGEELGLSLTDLKGDGLVWKAAYEHFDVYPHKNFYNREWRDVFAAEIATPSLENICFADKEVVGIYLCPAFELKQLRNQSCLPLASGLKRSLPFLLPDEDGGS